MKIYSYQQTCNEYTLKKNKGTEKNQIKKHEMKNTLKKKNMNVHSKTSKENVLEKKKNVQ